MRIKWEASTDNSNNMVKRSSHSIQWQLFRDMESTPLQQGILQHNSGGSGSSGMHTIGGFGVCVVDLVEGQVLLGDTLILRLRALPEERGKNIFSFPRAIVILID